MLGFKKKKIKCDHYWHKLNEYKQLEYFLFHIPSWQSVKYANCFCHLCNEHITVQYDTWLLEEKAQEIKKKYK